MSLPPTTPVRFLLVDDLEENLLALEALLRRDGLEMLCARSGREALEFLLVHDVALAIVDVQMPEMDGFELAELMRGNERTRRVPIIFLTAGGTDERRQFRGYEAGAVDFLYKPVDSHILRSKADVFFELYRQRQEVARQRDELREAAQENSRLCEELHATNQRKDEFLAILAHELRNPLAPIRMGLDAIRLVPEDGAALEETITTMQGQVAHMVRLIDDLLDVGRITRGKLELKRSRVVLADVIRMAVESTRPQITESDHVLNVTLPESQLVLNADPARISQVLSNLLNNAAKYSPRGSLISLTAKPEGSEVVISVQDNGLGIPTEMLDEVFQMFSQIDRTLEHSHGGLGIGLHLVRQIVQMHGGSVTARSDGDGKGSEFLVRLPLDAGRPDIAPTAPSLRPNGECRRVLVADDNRDAAEMLRRLLTVMGHDVRTAYDGLAALEVAEAFHPDICLLDLGMPKLNGYDTAQALRQKSWTDGLMLVALTGWGTEEDRRRAIAAGFDRHMVKPIDRHELQSLLFREPKANGLVKAE